MLIVAYNLILFPVGFGALRRLRRSRRVAALLGTAILHQAMGLFLAIVVGVLGGWGPFGWAGLFAWCVFVHAPCLGVLAWVRERRRAPALARSAGVLALAVAGVGVDAFFVEPRWLEVTELEHPVAGLRRTIRIAVVSDLQTDSVGDWERAALLRVANARPDLVLFPGDFLHFKDVPLDVRRREADRLQALFLEVDLDPPLGAFAVRGNVDGPRWKQVFEGTRIRPIDPSESLDLGEIVLTALDDGDSARSDQVVLRPRPRVPHVVFGHRPDFALGSIDADLLAAGHCHGGQVRLPWIGPLVTLSAVPRRWADTPTLVRSGSLLVVPRGVGMERGHAPRLRFLCRPELMFVELVPHQGSPPSSMGT